MTVIFKFAVLYNNIHRKKILETVKLLGSTKNKITKNENREVVPQLEITEEVLIHYSIVNSDCQQDSRVLYTFVPNK